MIITDISIYINLKYIKDGNIRVRRTAVLQHTHRYKKFKLFWPINDHWAWHWSSYGYILCVPHNGPDTVPGIRVSADTQVDPNSDVLRMYGNAILLREAN